MKSLMAAVLMHELIYIDLMRKRCQLINVDVDVECKKYGRKKNRFPLIGFLLKVEKN